MQFHIRLCHHYYRICVQNVGKTTANNKQSILKVKLAKEVHLGPTTTN